ncbi:TldD/PmbA family protein [Aquipuribacter nitratireducens]|uniref:TldD/PmbA family protein n=1 Tax=Aquipuribacter nitratireducens TaxID=650104 RepID=A0ABW0GKJ3_9MICO
MPGSRGVDADFLALPLDALVDAALQEARDAGATYAAVRVQRSRDRVVRVRDRAVEGVHDTVRVGVSVRVVLDGAWGFAATGDLTPEAARAAATVAVRGARVARPLVHRPVELADAPVEQGTWVSPYDVDPFDVPAAEQAAVLVGWCGDVLATGGTHADALVHSVKEQKLYADLAGTRTVQQRVRVQPEVTAVVVADDGRADTMRSLTAPSARGWEHVVAPGGCTAEAPTLAPLAAEKLAAPSVEPGRYDLVIDPTQLWLTVHESVAHATELDRAFGYEAAYAGTSFATPDGLGTRRYGSDLMTVTGDRTEPHGLSSLGWDDEGVPAQRWDIVRDGRHVGYQLDRAMAAERGERSNGCAYADEPLHAPLQRMPNVSLAADPAGPASLEALVAGVEDGILVVGDRSWSIDMQRFNFQFTAQRFHRIRSGRLDGMLRDVAYQASTPDFWSRLAAVGGPGTWSLQGALNCGKGQPGQAAPVSHGCPAVVVTDVSVLNTEEEGR